MMTSPMSNDELLKGYVVSAVNAHLSVFPHGFVAKYGPLLVTVETWSDGVVCARWVEGRMYGEGETDADALRVLAANLGELALHFRELHKDHLFGGAALEQWRAITATFAFVDDAVPETGQRPNALMTMRPSTRDYGRAYKKGESLQLEAWLPIGCELLALTAEVEEGPHWDVAYLHFGSMNVVWQGYGPVPLSKLTCVTHKDVLSVFDKRKTKVDVHVQATLICKTDGATFSGFTLYIAQQEQWCAISTRLEPTTVPRPDMQYVHPLLRKHPMTYSFVMPWLHNMQLPPHAIAPATRVAVPFHPTITWARVRTGARTGAGNGTGACSTGGRCVGFRVVGNGSTAAPSSGSRPSLRAMFRPRAMRQARVPTLRRTGSRGRRARRVRVRFC